MATMTGDPAPLQGSSATTDDFHEIAKKAGIQLKEALQKDLESGTNYEGFSQFEIKPYRDILKGVMERFETQVGDIHIAYEEESVSQISLQVFKERHEGGGRVEWRVIRLITRPRSFDENSFGGRPGNPCILALLVKKEVNIGLSYSLHKEHTVEEGDVFIGYEVV